MTDLSDFGGGIDRSELGKTDQFHASLSDWIRSDTVSVYSRKQKSYTDGTFKNDRGFKPNLLIEGPSYTYVLKTQIADDGSDVYEEIYTVFKYWRALTQGKESYSVDGQPITVDAVLLATDFSRAGKLFHDRQNKDPLRTGRSEEATKTADSNQIPKLEHAASETALRVLWKFVKYHTSESDIGIGALLSSVLDDDPEQMEDAALEEYSPAALYYTPSEEHVHSWNYLPFFLQNNT
ncbi:hypothetical protein [Halobellus rufus]|uniref:hypothetical protein n=1 Tax=Halobellus rufus TaxID=1448860 RepID=UPI00067959E5|nr:hypothetical protein [Halobellus rufus]